MTEVYTYTKNFIPVRNFSTKTLSNCIKSDGRRILYFTQKKVLGKFGQAQFRCFSANWKSLINFQQSKLIFIKHTIYHFIATLIKFFFKCKFESLTYFHECVNVNLRWYCRGPRHFPMGKLGNIARDVCILFAYFAEIPICLKRVCVWILFMQTKQK